MHSRSQIGVIGNSWFPDRPGGLDRYVYELVHTLAESHNDIDLFGIGLPSKSAVPAIGLTNLACPDQSLWRRLQSAYAHARPLQTAHLDAVNIHFALYGLAALPHIPKDIPVTCTFHGPWAIESQKEGERPINVWLKRQMEQMVYRRCDRFIVLSKAFGRILHQDYGISWDDIHVIPGGVDIQRFQSSLSPQEARDRLGWPSDRFILFTPRRLVNRMGLGKLLTALSQLGTQNQEIWLAIAGKGPLRDALEAQAEALGLHRQVKFLGYLPDDDLPTAYQAADLTVVPSQSLEGFGLVILESLACGTPALCTPVGGMPEILNGFSPELITSSADADAIATTVKAALNGSIKLPNRSACRDHATAHFNWPKIAGQVEQVLLRGG